MLHTFRLTLAIGLVAIVACATNSPTERSEFPAAAPAPAPAPAAEPKADAEGPPIAKRNPKVRELHGERFVDDYFWLREKGTPAVESHLKAEAAYAAKQLGPLKKFEDELYTEIVSHIAEDDETVPAKDGKFEYWSKVEKGKQYPTFLRRPVGKKVAAAEVVLDMNALAEGKAFLGLGSFSVNDDGTRLLFSIDETGFRQFTLQVKDLATGAVLGEKVEKVVHAVWASDAKTIFYTVEDEAKRPYRAYRHIVGTPTKDDALVYEETDGRFELAVGRTTSRAFVVLHSESKLSTEVRIIDAKKPESAPVLVDPRTENVKYDVEHDGTSLVIRTNDSGRNFRIVTAAPKSPGRKSWKELVKHDEAVMIEAIQPIGGRVVLQVRRAGVPELDVVEPKTKKRVAIAVPEVDHNVWIDVNYELDAPTFRYGYESMATPDSVFSYDFKTGKSVLLKEQPVPGGFDRTRYQTAHLDAVAKDGTKVPISLVAKKDVKRDGSAPMFLQAYGSYGYAYPTIFDPSVLPLLDRGVVVAIAHIRGGGEMGKAWHEAGRLAHKMNTFTDFIASAEHLIAEKWTSPKGLVIHGGSAGGLLMGAVTNLRPDLFQAVISDVPFVDVVNTMNDATLPLTITEYEEWGNPTKKDEFAWMRAYSPYDNIEAKAYPAIFVRSSYNDSQVMYWEPAKYVALLRAKKTDQRPLLFRIHMEPAGHGGKSGRYERFRQSAQMHAFALWQQSLGPIPAR